jgi:hypothetical protein
VYGSSKNNTRYQMLKAYARETGIWAEGESVDPIFESGLLEEIYRVRAQIRKRINEQGGLEDAFGRLVPLSAWDGKKKEDRWRGVLAYVNASYELALIWECFEAAIEEKKWAAQKNSRRPRFRIWLLQGDGFTLRVDRKRDPEPIIERLKERVGKKAEELGMVTALSVEQNGPVTSEEPTVSTEEVVPSDRAAIKPHRGERSFDVSRETATLNRRLGATEGPALDG